MAEPQNVNAGLVATAVTVTCAVVTALVIGTHAFFYYEVDEETKAKSAIVGDPTIPNAVAQQKANIQSPKEPGQIPINKAKELYIQAQQAKAKTAQAPVDGATNHQP